MENRIFTTAIQLALKFSDETDIPARLKNKSESQKRTISKQDSLVEKRFQDNVRAWNKVIEKILAKVETQQAWRFINLSPSIEPEIKGVTYCKDFLDFTDYFVLRRDIEKCDHEEVGLLAMLHTAFQREIERKILKGLHLKY